MELPEDIFVVVAEHSAGNANPFVVETNIPATKKQAEFTAKRLTANGYGETKIGRVVFSDLDQVRPIKTCGALLADVDKLDDFYRRLCEMAGEEWDEGDTGIIDKQSMRMVLLEWVRSL